MADRPTADQKFKSQAQRDANRTRMYGIFFILAGGLIQLLHLVDLNVGGFPIMVIIAGIILGGSGILFILGSYTVPTTRQEFIERLQKIMIDNDPERRLWAAQRLVGYAKEANFTKQQILSLAKHAAKMVRDNPASEPYNQYVAVDHIILLRELAVSVTMDKHTRKEFAQVVKPLQKIEGFDDKVYEVLADAIAYHPDKLPIQAYNDIRNQVKKVE